MFFSEFRKQNKTSMFFELGSSIAFFELPPGWYSTGYFWELLFLKWALLVEIIHISWWRKISNLKSQPFKLQKANKKNCHLATDYSLHGMLKSYFKMHYTISWYVCCFSLFYILNFRIHGNQWHPKHKHNYVQSKKGKDIRLLLLNKMKLTISRYHGEIQTKYHKKLWMFHVYFMLWWN